MAESKLASDDSNDDANSGIRFVDLQVNGYVGVDFNSVETTAEQVIAAVHAMQADGVVKALPTVITASPDHMHRCIRTICEAVRSDVDTRSVVAGIHIEGPFLSPVDGFVGAHPVRHTSKQDLVLLAELCEAAEGLVRLVTLAPEVDIDARMTRFCVDKGIRVAAGHTDASVSELSTCIDAGLSLFTHLGNACPRLLDRHDNIIYRALRFRNRIHYSLIADGHHIPKVLFQNLIDWIPATNILVVSDAISAAGLGVGVFQLGEREVRIGADKAARDISGEHFVGSASIMRDADAWLRDTLGLDWETRRRLLETNPLRYLDDPIA